MRIREQDLAAITDLGYTSEEARFLYVVATHSGYFQPRQFVAASGFTSGGYIRRLTAKLESRGHATWREYQDMGGVYHLLSKTIYRRIEKTDLRNCRRHSTEYIRTRLLLLDFMLENSQHDYFETETDKLVYFCGERGLPKEVLPAKVYPSASGAPPAHRYFVDKFPLFLDRSQNSSPVIALSYVDAGQAGVTCFARHLQQYATLLSRIGDFSFIYIAYSPANFLKAERCFDSLVRQRFKVDAVKDIVRYFGRRRAWDRQQYGQFSPDDVEALQSAIERYKSPEIEALYSSWVSHDLDDISLDKVLARECTSANATFHTYLVRGHSDSIPKKSRAARSGLDPRASRATSGPTSAPKRTEVAEISGDRD